MALVAAVCGVWVVGQADVAIQWGEQTIRVVGVDGVQVVTGSLPQSLPHHDSVAVIPQHNITASIRPALVLAAVPGLLLTGTEVPR
jgi:hypothetical protein